jgi:hypothetical protein
MPQFEEKSIRKQKPNPEVFSELRSPSADCREKFYGTLGQNRHTLAGAYPARKASIKVPK